MFTLQGPAIAQTLTQGGLAAPQAAQLTNLIANCRQPLEHRGAVNYDVTIPQMREIKPADVKTGGAMPSFGEAFNPPESSGNKPPTEEPPVREPSVGDTINNNDNRSYTNNTYNLTGVEAGKYIEAQKTKVSVKTSEGGGRHTIFGDGVFKGVTFKFEEERGGRDAPALTGSFEEREGETVLKLGMKTQTFTYVKSIELQGDQLYIRMGTLRAFGAYDSSADTSIPVTHCDDTAVKS